MYLNASAESLAENFVLAPISIALSLKASNSEPVTPEIALTSDIPASKSVAVFTAAAPTPTIGNVMFFDNKPPVVLKALDKPFNFCSAVADLSPNTFKSL